MTETISCLHRRRQSPPLPHTSMTKRQRAAKVSSDGGRSFTTTALQSVAVIKDSRFNLSSINLTESESVNLLLRWTLLIPTFGVIHLTIASLPLFPPPHVTMVTGICCTFVLVSHVNEIHIEAFCIKMIRLHVCLISCTAAV